MEDDALKAVIAIVVLIFWFTLYVNVCSVDSNTNITNQKLDKIIELMEAKKWLAQNAVTLWQVAHHTTQVM